MNSDAFFSESRWKILEIITSNPSSPVEISKKINTSTAYVSQQLKLLEAANLIAKKRTGSAEKGKPRSLYFLSRELLHLTALIRGNPAKKLIYLSDHHKIILKIWLLENSDLHYFVEKFYWRIEEDLKEIKGIYFDSSKKRLIIISESKIVKAKINSFSKVNELDVSVISELDLRNFLDKDLFLIYDPNSMLSKRNVKGGNDLR